MRQKPSKGESRVISAAHKAQKLGKKMFHREYFFSFFFHYSPDIDELHDNKAVYFRFTNKYSYEKERKIGRPPWLNF